MCGIIGIISNKSIIKKASIGLKRLEYRGYDSAGISFFYKNNIKTIKNMGSVDELYPKVKNFRSTIAIGHTRWATNGKPSIDNCHPIASINKKVFLVHNGIIENYVELKNKYLKSIKLYSQTDTEIICNLIEQFLTKNNDKLYAINQTMKLLIGSYAIAILFCDEPNKIYFAKNKSPLLIGIDKNEKYISSDFAGFEKWTKQFIEIDNLQYGYIDKNDIKIFDKNKELIEIKLTSIKNNSNHLTKFNYQHYMIKEINEIPKCLLHLTNLYSSKKSPLSKIKKLKNKKIDRIWLIGCGTSYHACLIGEKYLNNFGLDSTSQIASEFIYSTPILTKNTLCIFISQSGETADTISAIEIAKQKNAICLGITNVETSQIAKMCDYNLPICSGPEIAVASTKAYNNQIAVLYLLANFLSKNDINKRIKDIKTLSKKINIQNFEKQIVDITPKISDYDKIFVCGKNYDYITSLEGALKLKEISYINTQGIASGEFKHGTIALVDKKTLVIAYLTDRLIADKTINIVNQVKSRGAKIIGITNIYEKKFEQFDNVVYLPKCCCKIAPMISIIPMQLLAYHTSIQFGYNPDKPRNLAKSVTVE